MRLSDLELRLSWDLAFKLGAILPRSAEEHRALYRHALRCRDPRNNLPMFWPWAQGLIAAKSS